MTTWVLPARTIGSLTLSANAGTRTERYGKEQEKQIAQNRAESL